MSVEAEGVLRSFLEEATGTPPPELSDAAALSGYLTGIESSTAAARANVLDVVCAQQSAADGMLLYAEEVRDELHTLQSGVAALPHGSFPSELKGVLQASTQSPFPTTPSLLVRRRSACSSTLRAAARVAAFSIGMILRPLPVPRSCPR